MAGEYDIDGEWEWGEDEVGKKICALEEALRCAICSELFRNPHALPCGHSFCSECIRKHLDQRINPTTSTICPSCRSPGAVPQLRPSRDVDTIVRHFVSLRPSLLSLVKGAIAMPSLDTSATPRNQRSNGVSKAAADTSLEEPLRRLAPLSFHQQPRDKVRAALDKLCSSCPIKIRTDGDKEALERRHMEFVHLNNAQLMSATPMTLREMVEEINRRENNRDKEKRKLDARTAKMLADLKEGKVAPALKNNFATLTEKVKEQKRRSATPAKEQKIDASSTDQWRVVFSDVAGIPFFYNTALDIGQFAVPPELEHVYGTTDTARSEEGTQVSDNSSTRRNPDLWKQLSSLSDDSTPVQTARREQFYSLDDSAPQSTSTMVNSLREITDLASSPPRRHTIAQMSQSFEDGSSTSRRNTCPYCTYDNEPEDRTCQMCMGNLAASPAPRRMSTRSGSQQSLPSLYGHRPGSQNSGTKRQNGAGSAVRDTKKTKR